MALVAPLLRPRPWLAPAPAAVDEPAPPDALTPAAVAPPGDEPLPLAPGELVAPFLPIDMPRDVNEGWPMSDETCAGDKPAFDAAPALGVLLSATNLFSARLVGKLTTSLFLKSGENNTGTAFCALLTSAGVRALLAVAASAASAILNGTVRARGLKDSRLGTDLLRAFLALSPTKNDTAWATLLPRAETWPGRPGDAFVTPKTAPGENPGVAGAGALGAWPPVAWTCLAVTCLVLAGLVDDATDRIPVPPDEPDGGDAVRSRKLGNRSVLN